MERGRADLILRGFYEEMLRASNEEIRGRGGVLRAWRVGRFEASPSRRGGRCPRTGRALDPHWAFRFRPYRRMVSRCAEICEQRRG
ncbi:MAG: hypothetical protein ACYTGB_14025 [Planctomycetota bacterium]